MCCVCAVWPMELGLHIQYDSLDFNMCLHINMPWELSRAFQTCLLCTCNDLIIPIMCAVLVSTSVGFSSLSVLSLTDVFPSALLRSLAPICSHRQSPVRELQCELVPP